MCDYSLHHVATRNARAGDKIVSTNFVGTVTRGFADPAEPGVAVCLRPGTEIAFEEPVAYYSLPGCASERTEEKVARFTQIDKDRPHTHHDALEFADGRKVLLAHLIEGQKATVLQLGLAEPVPEERPAIEATLDIAQPSELVMGAMTPPFPR